MTEQQDAIDKARASFARGVRPMLIHGQWVGGSAGGTFDILDPSTEQVLCAVAEATPADVDRAVSAARRAFEGEAWSGMSPYDRTNLLLRIADIIADNIDELAAIQSHEMGMLYAQSQWMVGGAVDVFRYYAGWVTKILGHSFPDRGVGVTYTRREPLGVVGSIIPWNGPSGATAWKIAPALACGNTVVLKPAEQAPLVSLRMVELIQQAGLPDGVLNVVTGAGDVGAALVAHPDIDKISFTGSTETGKQIVASGATTMKRVTLELGGKSPTIIFADADLTKAIPAAVMGFSIAAGQGCVAGSRILVHRSIYDEVARQMTEAAARLRVGSAFDAQTEIPAIVSQEQYDRVMGYIALGREQGAQLTCGGDAMEGDGYFVQPTVFTNVSPDMRIAQEEIFGPVAAIIPFETTSEAIRLANAVEYGLSASIWTADIGTAQTVSAAVKAGIVWVNTIFELDPMAPFGGFKQSGLGRELGPDSIDSYTQTKTVVLRP